MSAKDLDSILPASNADNSDSSEYEEYYSDDEDEKEVTKATTKAKKHINKTKRSSIKEVSEKQKVRTKRPKGPSRSFGVNDTPSKGGGGIPPLQTNDPTAHALEAPKPMLVKQALDNEFNKTHKIDLTRATQLGIKKEGYDPDPIKEMYEEEANNKWYKQKKWIITMSVITAVILLLAIGFAVYYFTKRRVLSHVDPLNSPITGGSNESKEDDKKDINYITSPSLNKDKNPPSFYDDYDKNSEKDEEIADNVDKDIPKGKNTQKTTPKNSSKPKESKKVYNKSNRKLPERGKNGRFVKSKK